MAFQMTKATELAFSTPFWLSKIKNRCQLHFLNTTEARDVWLFEDMTHLDVHVCSLHIKKSVSFINEVHLCDL